MYAVLMLCIIFAPKFRKLILGKYTITTSLNTDTTTDDSKQKERRAAVWLLFYYE